MTTLSPSTKNPKYRHYLGNPKLKAPGVQIQWTLESATEYAKCQNDPIYFIKNYMKIINMDKGEMLFEMWPFQETMVNTFDDNRFTICKLCRQVGKSTTVCAYFLWLVLFKPTQALGILANKGDLARVLLAKITFAYEALPFWLQQGVVEWNKGSIKLENGSTIMATTTSSAAARGHSFTTILLDEFAFVHRNMQEAFYNSMYPTISSGKTTKLIIVSTPNGIGDVFYKIWQNAKNGQNNFKTLEINWWDVPGRDEAWKKETIANTSERQFRQEFGTEFLGSMDTLIDPVVIGAMKFGEPIYENDQGIKLYEKPLPDTEYAIVCDVSRGAGIDYSAFVIVKIVGTEYSLVGTYRDNEVSPLHYPSIIYNVAKAFNNAWVMVEINDNGQQIVDILFDEFEYENIVYTGKDKRGITQVGAGLVGGKMIQRGVRTTKQVKRLGCALLKNLVENHKLQISDIDTIGELSTFIQVKDSYEAQEGCHDDMAMCLVLFAWMINQEFFKQHTSTNLRTAMYNRQQAQIEEGMSPFGIIDNGMANELKMGYGENPDTVNEWNEDVIQLMRG